MLRNESVTARIDRSLFGAQRMLTIIGLLGLAIGVATLRRPASAADDAPARAEAPKAAPNEPSSSSKSFVTPFIRAGADCVAVIRPAAAFRHPETERLLALCQTGVDQELFYLRTALKVDTSTQGFTKLRCLEIEWLTICIGFDQSPPQALRDTQRAARNPAAERLRRITVGSLAIRMVAPFDWLAFLRQFRLECAEARASGHLYYKIGGERKGVLGPSPAMLLFDDRTVVFDQEDEIRKIASGAESPPPAHLQSNEWAQASRGLIAIAFNNRNDAFAKHYDPHRADDAVVLSFFKGLDSWILGVEDADAITLQGKGACRDPGSAAAVSRSLDSLIKRGRDYIERNAPKAPDAGAHDVILRMLKALMANVRVLHTDNSVGLRSDGLGTLADVALVVDGEAQESKARAAARSEAKRSVSK
jgi:hypothetical protein